MCIRDRYYIFSQAIDVFSFVNVHIIKLSCDCLLYTSPYNRAFRMGIKPLLLGKICNIISNPFECVRSVIGVLRFLDKIVHRKRA